MTRSPKYAVIVFYVRVSVDYRANVMLQAENLHAMLPAVNFTHQETEQSQEISIATKVVSTTNKHEEEASPVAQIQNPRESNYCDVLCLYRTENIYNEPPIRIQCILLQQKYHCRTIRSLSGEQIIQESRSQNTGFTYKARHTTKL